MNKKQKNIPKNKSMGRRLVSFDWAIKRLLRSKANFVILEGFLSVLLGEQIEIKEILESESNRDYELDKQTRVDIKVARVTGEIIIIELQFNRELDYFQRILFGVSKVLIEHLKSGDRYADVKKVISVNIIFFEPGIGDDYIYHGTTDFVGIHSQNTSELSAPFQNFLQKSSIKEVFPEYYLLCVNRFNDVAKNSLDEWVFFLKNEEIEPQFTAQGLQEANRVLEIARLDPQERAAYERYEEDRHYEASQAARIAFEMEWAEKQGRERGAKESKLEIAKNMQRQGLSDELIKVLTGVDISQL